MKKETFTAARERLFSELADLGWTIQKRNTSTLKPLKVPYAIAPNGERVWFKPQSLYAGGNNLNTAYSICSDYRGLRGQDVDREINR